MINSDAQSPPSRHNTLDRTSLREVQVRPRRGSVLRFSIALGFIAAGLGLTLLLEPFLQRTIFLLFWPAPIGTAWLAGLWPALFTASASVALVDYFVITPKYTWGPWET